MKYSANSHDNDLITGCIEQNRLAQKYLYERYYGRLLGVSMRYTSDKEEATSILNQAFLRIFKYIKNYNDQGNLMGWMARIALNTSIDHARKNMRYKKTMFYNEDAPDISVENEVIQQLKSEDLFKLIQRLKPGQRTVFSLYVIDGFKHREIAERLDISQGTSKWHLAEAKKELRSLLEKQMRNSYIA